MRKVEERTRRPEQSEPLDPASAVVLDTVLALRQVVRERGPLPFAFAGLRAMDALGDLGATLDRCLGKKGMPGWPASARSLAEPNTAVRRKRRTSGRRMAGCARSRAAWSRRLPKPPRSR